jgi:hypothetical protein
LNLEFFHTLIVLCLLLFLQIGSGMPFRRVLPEKKPWVYSIHVLLYDFFHLQFWLCFCCLKKINQPSWDCRVAV